MVVPCRANSRTFSRSGIGVLPPSRRVSTRLCAISGTVISRPAAAATAENADTPGMISTSIPRSTQRSYCSCTAPHSDGSPECTLATRRPRAAARS